MGHENALHIPAKKDPYRDMGADVVEHDGSRTSVSYSGESNSSDFAVSEPSTVHKMGALRKEAGDHIAWSYSRHPPRVYHASDPSAVRMEAVGIHRKVDGRREEEQPPYNPGSIARHRKPPTRSEPSPPVASHFRPGKDRGCVLNPLGA